MPSINFNDSSIFYETKGKGEPLILIPGFASGAWSWFAQIDELSKHFRVITYDPRGIGGSQAKSADDSANLSLETFVDDVLKILDALEIEKSHVLGASFGGFVAQEFALRYPARLDKLVLCCTSAGGANHVRPSNEILKSFAPDPSMTLGEKVRLFIRPAFTEKFNVNCAEQVENVCRLREQNIVGDAAYSAQLQTAFSFDTEGRLGEIHNQTLVITGDQDIVVPMENSLNLAKNILRSTLAIIPGGSHLFFIENAAAFNRAVTVFLLNYDEDENY